MNEVQRNLEELKEAFAAEIIKAQTRFVHICLAAIMPKELYDLAAADNQMQRCEAWAKAEGYTWHAVIGELRLIKNGVICARFQPVIEGPVENRKCVFFANVLGKPVNVAAANPLLN